VYVAILLVGHYNAVFCFSSNDSRGIIIIIIIIIIRRRRRRILMVGSLRHIYESPNSLNISIDILVVIIVIS
jgi:hypothetical protein